jgi:outer membrane receptor protein involved in Fe transport
LRSGAVREDEPLPDAIYDSAGFFAEDNFSAGPKASVNLGFRGDAIIVENDENPRIEADTEQDLSYNGHIGGTYEVTDALSAKGLVARSYRAASLDERFQFLQLGGGIVKLGNPELDPEHSTFVELGLEWGAPEAFVSVSAFGNYLEDLISGRRIDETTIRNENVSQARIEGIELASTFLLADDLEAKGNFTYMEGRDTARDEYLPGIPPFNGFVSVKKGRGIGPWAELQGEFAAEQNKTPEGVRDAGGWMIFNLDAGWRWTTDRAEHTVFVGMQNIFDADYRDYLATHRGNVYDEPGRSVSLGYKAAF